MTRLTDTELEALRGHTPCDWYVNDTPVHSDIRRSSEDAERSDPLIVEFPYGIETAEQKADAALIAAAPALLAEAIERRAQDAAVAELVASLENISALSTALRQGAPEPMDLQELSDNLWQAVDISVNALAAFRKEGAA